MGKTPRIAIPRWRQPIAERALHYAKAIKAVGGRPVFIDLGQPFDGFDGLLLMGGADIDPACYGDRATSLTGRTNPKRDAHELAILETALARDLPVLGICRGHQLLNIALGGKLLQHIQDHREDGSDSAWHEVELSPKSRLAAIYNNARGLRVNSRHHQGVSANLLASQLIGVARSGEIVEAVEERQHRWIIGVQWHPERSEMQPAGGLLFRAFVEECRR